MVKTAAKVHMSCCRNTKKGLGHLPSRLWKNWRGEMPFELHLKD